MQAKQNWVLGFWQDLVWVIGAPLWAILLVVWGYHQFGFPVVALSVGIYSIAHHFPTFLRIYGDRDLLKRFRWSILLAPLIPFLSVMAIVAYVVSKGLSTTRISYVFVFLVIWAPWHLMMQHYGFMRIYDRHNSAPRRIQSNMDWTLCIAWFMFILTATLHWLPELLYMLHLNGLPVLTFVDPRAIQFAESATWIVATIMTLAYFVYVFWCVGRGYFVSYAKLLLVVFTFGMLYVTCVPNPLIQYLSPDWNFALGLLTLSVAHNSQYFAIVWRFNRRLAEQPERRREGWFRSAFARGGIVVILVYVIASLLYGGALSDLGQRAGVWMLGPAGQWLVGTILALAFTSELMHYYYDGFVWKVRHRETRVLLESKSEASAADAVAANAVADTPANSWWSRGGALTPVGALLRHALYFGIVLAFLSAFYWTVAYPNNEAALVLSRRAMESRSPADASRALRAIENQIDIESRMNRLRERACHYAYLADLWVMKAELETQATGRMTEAANQDLNRAVLAIDEAIRLPPPLKHLETQVIASQIHKSLDGRMGSDELSREDYQRWGKRLRLQLELGQR